MSKIAGWSRFGNKKGRWFSDYKNNIRVEIKLDGCFDNKYHVYIFDNNKFTSTRFITSSPLGKTWKEAYEWAINWMENHQNTDF